MKNWVVLFTAVIFIALCSCKEKIDIEKEKEAIKAVFEQEKEGFFARDFDAMAETWIQEPSSVKIFMSAEGQTKFEGWDAISKNSRQDVADTTWDSKQVTLTFKNYQINILDDESAWVMCDALWEGTYQNAPMSSTQTRILVLKKTDGKWKFALMALYNQPQEK
jgi:ketosteroid isomerase-like protein